MGWTEMSYLCSVNNESESISSLLLLSLPSLSPDAIVSCFTLLRLRLVHGGMRGGRGNWDQGMPVGSPEPGLLAEPGSPSPLTAGMALITNLLPASRQEQPLQVRMGESTDQMKQHLPSRQKQPPHTHTPHKAQRGSSGECKQDWPGVCEDWV